MSKNNTDTIVTFVLDKSESMRIVESETVKGINEYLETLRGDDTPTLLHLMAFNSKDVDVIYDFEDVSYTKDMTSSNYVPDGLTPLYDSIGQGIRETERYMKFRPGDWKVIFTIMTDGIENFSTKYNRQQILELIAKKEKQGWLFVYLGANQDAWEVAESIGIKRQYAANYDAYGPDVALKTMADSTVRGKFAMRSKRRPRDMFTEEERVRLLEKKLGIKKS